MNTLVSSTTTLNPPSRTCATGAVRTSLILKSFFQALAAFLCCQTFVGEKNLSLTVVYFQDFGFHCVANMDYSVSGRALVSLVYSSLGNDTVRFVTNIQE